MGKKAKILDEMAISRALARITHEIIERNSGAENLVLLGVKTRGVYLAEVLAENIAKFEGVKAPVGELDITMKRDDLSEEEKEKKVGGSVIPFSISDKTVIIVDDVLYTGRTQRAAMEETFSFGRPKAIQIAVLIDRGHRELPIRADYVGKNVPTSKAESVSVKVGKLDGENAVYICD